MSLPVITDYIDSYLGKKGGLYVSDTSAHTGIFTGILVITDASVTAVGNITGLTTAAVKQNTYIPGVFTSVTLGSGTCILFK
jgi:hypothetical protein